MTELEKIGPEELHDKMQAGEGVLLVCSYRSEIAFKKYRIPQAISGTDLTERLPSLSEDQEIVFYCACQGDKTAIEWALAVAEQGFRNCKVLERGFSGWLTAGYRGGRLS